MKIRLSSLVIAAGAVLAGCATTPSQPPVQSAPITSPSSSAPTISLEAEQRRLAELFKGTPVVWQMTPEGALKVDVPAKFCFDKGTAVVKPPLAKVLDYVAPSAKAAGMKAKVYAPADPKGSSTVAQDRAASARDYLVSKGVPVTHIAGLAPTSDDHVEIVISKL